MIKSWRKTRAKLLPAIGTAGLDIIKLFQPLWRDVAALLGGSAFVPYVHGHGSAAWRVIIFKRLLYKAGFVLIIVPLVICQHLYPIPLVPLLVSLSFPCGIFGTIACTVVFLISWMLRAPLLLIFSRFLLVAPLPVARHSASTGFAV